MLHCQTQIKAPLDGKRPFFATKKQTVERVYGKPLLYRLSYRHSSSISLKKKNDYSARILFLQLYSISDFTFIKISSVNIALLFSRDDYLAHRAHIPKNII